MPLKMKLTAIMVCAVLTGCTTLSPQKTSYHEQHQLFSEKNDEGYLTGEGMGYAMLADENHYPGPRHVLDLAKELKLSPQQIKDSQTLFDQMQKDASELGKKLVAKQKIFHHLFRTGQINDDTLAMLLTEMSILETKIRYVHLSAHLKQRAILTPNQIEHYDILRRYNTDESPL